MTPVFHPTLVNSPFEDPCVYVDFLFSRRAMLFDLGTLTGLSPRKILRIGHVFVSHAHIDHFIGFDHLVRLCLGRDKRVHLFGPAGFVDQVWHRLASYTWNLVYSYESDFTIIASEVHADGSGLTTEFHCLHGFKPENTTAHRFTGGLIHEEEGLTVRAAVLDHKTASLAFSLEERQHVNVMKNRLDEMGLAVGPWLKELKAAVIRGEADNTQIAALAAGGATVPMTLGEVRERATRVEAGQKVCYVTDAGYTAANAERIVALAGGADYLFIEATFPEAEAGRALERSHLTARQAGELGRRAGAARVLPFHFSPRYTGHEQELRAEVGRAWHGA